MRTDQAIRLLISVVVDVRFPSPALGDALTVTIRTQATTFHASLTHSRNPSSDMSGYDNQPIRDNTRYAAYYFVVYV